MIPTMIGFEFNNGLRVNGSFVTADGGLNAGLVKFNEPTQGEEMASS